MKKLLEQRKREKEEEKLARQRVREQIESDKAARRARAASEAGKIPVSPAPSASTSAPVISGPKKDYSETKLQVNKSGEKFIYENKLSSIVFID